MLRNLLIYRMIILNVVGLAIVGWSFMQGYTQALLKEDVTYLDLIMTVIFILSLASAFIRASKVSYALNQLKSGRYLIMDPAKFEAKTYHIGAMTSMLISLGVFGTLIGLYIALQGTDGANMTTPQGMQDTMSQMMVGMKIAVGTAIVGTFYGLWMEANRIMIHTAMQCMFADANNQYPALDSTNKKISQHLTTPILSSSEKIFSGPLVTDAIGGVKPFPVAGE